MKKLKIGTFKCWLWGHIFLHEFRTPEAGAGNIMIRPSNYCTRYGITKE